MTGARLRKRRPVPVSEALGGLGARVRKARLEAGLSQAQLGAPHFTRAYVSAIELGKVRPAMKSLEFIADRLGRPASYFLEDEAEEQHRKEREVRMAEAHSVLSRSTATEALARFESLLPDVSSPRDLCEVRLGIGTALNFLVRGPEAVSHLAAAEKTASVGGDGALLRRVRHQLGLAHRNSGDPLRAETILVALLAELESTMPPDRLLQMKVLKDLGAVAFDRGDVDAAAAYLGAALVWANEIGDLGGLVAIYNGLAYTHRSRGDLDAALGYLQRALGATTAANDLVQAAMVHNSLAVMSAERGHVESALAHVDRAIQIARVCGPRAYLASTLNTRAECLLRRNDVDGAEECVEEALSLVRSEAQPGSASQAAGAAARVLLADIAARRGIADEATRQLEEAAATYEATGARRELGDVLMRLSRQASSRGDSASAQRYADRAYRVTNTAGHLPQGRS